MNDKVICPVCTTPLASGTPEDLCPACLLAAGLGNDQTDTRNEVDMIAEKPGDMVGRYRLVEQIGEGGFGVVFRAEQRIPVRRSVALKVVKPGMDSREVVTRFEAERQALALMDHPNIAKVYDAGTTDMGRPYFVMEHVEGQPLTVFCDKQALDIRARLELFVWICQAVQHAHQKGVIHRDLKPGNILVREGEEGPPLPKIIDFGVAKAIGIELTEKTFLTMFGRVLGTPLYMSPEQAGLNEVDVDTRSDIYTLGVVLYELVTGRTPLGEQGLSTASFDETRRRIREDEPLRPSARVFSLGDDQRRAAATARRIDPAKYRRYLSGDLDWIVMNALEKDRTRRYDTAQCLGADVRRYLDGLPVNAGPPGAAYRIKKFVRRHRGPVIASALALLAVIGATAGFWKVNIDKRAVVENKQREVVAKDKALKEEQSKVKDKNIALEKEKRKVEEERRLKEAERNEKEFQRLESLVMSVRNLRSEKQGSRKMALERLLDVAESLKEIEVTAGEAKKVLDEARGEFVACLAWTDLEENPLPINVTMDLADPAALDATRQRCALRAENGRLELWDIATGERRAFRTGSDSRIEGPLRFSPDGTLVAARFGTAERWNLVLWNWETDQDVATNVWGVHAAFDFHPGGNGIVVGTPAGKIAFYNLDGTPRREFDTPGESPLAIRFSPDGRHVAVGMEPSGVVVIDVETGEREAPWEEVSGVSLAWAPDGRSFVAGSADGSVTILERGAQKPVFSATEEHNAQVDQVAWSSDGRLIASACMYEIRLWDKRQEKLLCNYRAGARTLGFSNADSSGKQASLGPVLKDGTLSILEIQESRACHRAAGHRHQEKIMASTWLADGTVLATAADDGLRLWNLEGRQLAHDPNVRVRPGGLASSLPADTPVYLYLATEDGISRRAISTADGKLQCGSDEMLNDRIRDAEQILLGPLVGPVGPFLAVARDTEVVLLDPDTGKERMAPLKSPPSTAFLAISPDGVWLATGTRGGKQVRIWNLQPGGGFTAPPVDGGATVAFYPRTHHPGNGDLLPPYLMTGDDESYRLWTFSEETGDWKEVVENHPNKMTPSSDCMARMVFSPRGTVVVVTYDCHSLQILNPFTMEVMHRAFDQQWPLAISEDGRRMATEAPKGRLFIWDLAEVRNDLGPLDWSRTLLPPFDSEDSTTTVVTP